MSTQKNISPEVNEETRMLSKANRTKAGEAKSSKSSSWHDVLVGGVSGIILGAGAAILSGSVIPERDEMDHAETGGGSHGTAATVPDFDIHEAHSVNDDMTFGEAFAAARAEVGPGGVFAWHGHLYGTFRADDPEWQSMRAEDRTAFGVQAASQVHPDPYTPAADEPKIEPVEHPAEPVGGDDGVNPGDSGVAVHIVEVEQVECEDGIIATVGYGHADGAPAVMADIDGDGVVDALGIDENGDGELSDDEIYDIEAEGITVEDMHAVAEVENGQIVDDNLYADMPDYTNDADVSSFC